MTTKLSKNGKKATKQKSSEKNENTSKATDEDKKQNNFLLIRNIQSLLPFI